VLETVPGLIATQHSGEGKASQYFLRGFNLDHGTDFLTQMDGVPINELSHSHGQGWTDTNFLIPELVETLEYKKAATMPRTATFPVPAQPISITLKACLNISLSLPAAVSITTAV
jgi:TonB-dependent Receptor Plug Domain